jgi:hypothetical protein
VQHLSEGCSNLIRKLLMLLSQRACSKESLAQHLWRQDYNPLRHDGLIYPLIAKARKFLGRAGVWIEAYEFGYRLREGVRVGSASLFLDENEAEHNLPEREDVSARPEKSAALLNARQSLILEAMKRDEVVEPGALVKKFSVSDATITRDMATLIELGFARRVGRGRATQYRLETQTTQEG